MVLETQLCRLRPFERRDVDGLVQAANDPRIVRYLTHRFPYPYTREDARDWLDDVTERAVLSIFAIEVDGEVAGCLAIEPLKGENTGVAEIGYWLAPTHWGRGITSTALRAGARYAFDELRVRRLQAHVFSSNGASARVLEKAGFIRESVLERYFIDREGTVHDGYIYVIFDRTHVTP